jgi:hypothetical protein
VSRYANIPSENLKFGQFIDLIFKSKMQSDDIKEEVKKYVQAIETNYNDKIKDLNIASEKLQRRIKNINGQKAI